MNATVVAAVEESLTEDVLFSLLEDALFLSLLAARHVTRSNTRTRAQQHEYQDNHRFQAGPGDSAIQMTTLARRMVYLLDLAAKCGVGVPLAVYKALTIESTREFLENGGWATVEGSWVYRELPAAAYPAAPLDSLEEDENLLWLHGIYACPRRDKKGRLQEFFRKVLVRS